MVRRRNAFDPFAQTSARRWWVTRSMHGTVIESREIPAGADLKRLFVASMLERMDAGWQIGEFSSSCASFFCSRGVERQMVSIDPTDPHNVPMHGGARLMSPK